MSNSVRCPECGAKAKAVAGKAEQYRCLMCEEIFEIHELSDEPEPSPRTSKRRPPSTKERGKRTVAFTRCRHRRVGSELG